MVTVDGDFARFGDKSYAINKINTVEVREVTPEPMGIFTVLANIIAVLLIPVGFIALAMGSKQFGVTCLIIGSVVALPVYEAYSRPQTRRYTLVLMTSSSEAQAFTSSNRDEVESLRVKIEQAMVGRQAQV